MRRLAVGFVVLLTVAACGGSGMSSGGSTAPDVRVTFSPEPLRVGPVKWTVAVTNDTTHDLLLTFPSGKRVDVTLSKGGDVAYQWSRGILFTQEVGHVTVAAGDNKAFVLDEAGLEIDPGTYTLTATVDAAGHPELRTSTQVTVKGR